jgi:ubiquinone/menaquinone biosynthesis C-methylase UbiE
MTLERTLEPEVMDSVEEANDYDGMDHSTVNQVFVKEMLVFLRERASSHSPSSGILMADLGTGTIRIPLELTDQWPGCWRIAACDLSFEMLKLGRQHVHRCGRESLICPVHCDAKRLPFANRSVFVLMSNSIMHHIPHPLTLFKETRRCLAERGHVFFRDLLRPDSEDEVESLVATYAGKENAHAQKMFRESLHAALTVPEVDHMLQLAGFTGLRAVRSSDRHWTVAGSSRPRP